MRHNIIENMFDREMIFLDYEAMDADDFLDKIARVLYEKGYVKKEFKEAIKEREHIYPTGLPTMGVKVAIPHTDIIYALRPIIVVVKFRDAVAFKEMGDGENDIQAQLAFVLVVTEPDSQINTLQALMELFCKEGALERIYSCIAQDEMLRVLLQEIKA